MMAFFRTIVLSPGISPCLTALWPFPDQTLRRGFLPRQIQRRKMKRRIQILCFVRVKYSWCFEITLLWARDSRFLPEHNLREAVSVCLPGITGRNLKRIRMKPQVSVRNRRRPSVPSCFARTLGQTREVLPFEIPFTESVWLSKARVPFKEKKKETDELAKLCENMTIPLKQIRAGC